MGAERNLIKTPYYSWFSAKNTGELCNLVLFVYPSCAVVVVYLSVVVVYPSCCCLPQCCCCRLPLVRRCLSGWRVSCATCCAAARLSCRLTWRHVATLSQNAPSSRTIRTLTSQQTSSPRWQSEGLLCNFPFCYLILHFICLSCSVSHSL